MGEGYVKRPKRERGELPVWCMCEGMYGKTRSVWPTMVTSGESPYLPHCRGAIKGGRHGFIINGTRLTNNGTSYTKAYATSCIRVTHYYYY